LYENEELLEIEKLNSVAENTVNSTIYDIEVYKEINHRPSGIFYKQDKRCHGYRKLK
jgi:hypothetical protein